MLRHLPSIWLSLLVSVVVGHEQAQCWRDTVCSTKTQPSFPGVWEENSFSPTSRTVQPKRVLNLNHKELSAYPGRVPCLCSNGSAVIFDFGFEVGGIVTIHYQASGSGTLGLAFSEASNFTGYNSDESNGGSGPDLALLSPVNATGHGSYTMPLEKLRGGFRYMTVFALTEKQIQLHIESVELEIAYQPTWSNLRAYGGYFHSNDQLLNRIWYACAYVMQTTSVPPETGRVYPLTEGWLNNASLGTSAPSLLVDGAKRDRSAWPGDLLTAIPSLLVSTGDLETAKASVQVQFDYQNAQTGELPYAGPPLYFYGSDSYHLTTLIVLYDYVLFSGDMDFLTATWNNYTKAVGYMTAKIDSTGLVDITGTANWGRAAISSGHTTDGNAMMYRVLTTGAIMAGWLKDSTTAASYTALAQKLKSSMNSAEYNWDPAVGAFKNTDTDGSIFPEDGNSMALLYGLANSSSYQSVSQVLTRTWGPIGSVCPEAYPDNIVPFPEGLEIKAHLTARQAERALNLTRTSWGWYLNNPYGTGSGAMEGYLSDGSFKYHNDGYDNAGSYPSHAHGWSTGPADALISYLVGLRVTQPGGRSWVLEPQFGGLEEAQGGFTTPLGKFSAGWEQSGRGYRLWVNTPSGTHGTLSLPNPGCKSTALVDGARQYMTCDKSSSLMAIQVKGGKHEIVVF